MGVEALTQAICDKALHFGEDRQGKEEKMVNKIENNVSLVLLVLPSLWQESMNMDLFCKNTLGLS